MRVKLILPALTEATNPYWRPIKYSACHWQGQPGNPAQLVASSAYLTR
jgi:hypothetical protein